MGLLMMLVFRFGWAKPVPVNMIKFQNPKRGMAVTALAGPGCNLLLTVVFLFLYGLLIRPLSGNPAGEIILELLELAVIFIIVHGFDNKHGACTTQQPFSRQIGIGG